MLYDILFSELFTFLFQESYCIKFSRVVLVDFKTVIYHWLLKAYLARFVNLLLLSMKSRSKFPCLHQPIKWYTKRIYLSIGLVKTCYLIFFYHQDGFEKKNQQAGKCSYSYDKYCSHDYLLNTSLISY